jgi:hydrogenase nickel incorporation protein HypB
MCKTCGCDDGARVTVVGLDGNLGGDLDFGGDHARSHALGIEHPHRREREHTTTVTIEERVLAKNDDLAEANRHWLAERGIVAVNLMSSPGSGKTTLLERTLADLRAVPMAVIEGDQETLFDAERIRATGARVVQINTGAGCHLDAPMVARGLRTLDPDANSVVFIENVGNLVCPALFDLGESARVVVMSVTEGADKPLKYPHMFRAADLVLINKVDLLPYVAFDVDACLRAARQVNPDLEFIEVSATTGAGLADWYAWIAGTRAAAIAA